VLAPAAADYANLHLQAFMGRTFMAVIIYRRA
jgi:hypothetical protein